MSFHELQRGTGERIRHLRVAESSGEEVDRDDIVKGYDLGDGTHVVVEPSELEAVAAERSRVIDVERFVDLSEIDPVYFRRTYLVLPASQEAVKPYALLRRAMHDRQRAAVGCLVMRDEEHLVALRADDRVLVAQTLLFADEVRDPALIEEFELLEAAEEPSERELEMAGQLVDSLEGAWQHDEYRDTNNERVLEMIERKAQGEEVVSSVPGEEPQADVIDLMAALEQSVDRARRERDGASSDGASDPSFEDMTRDELYEAARRAVVEGRSSMSKDELVAALRSA